MDALRQLDCISLVSRSLTRILNVASTGRRDQDGRPPGGVGGSQPTGCWGPGQDRRSAIRRGRCGSFAVQSAELDRGESWGVMGETPPRAGRCRRLDLAECGHGFRDVSPSSARRRRNRGDALRRAAVSASSNRWCSRTRGRPARGRADRGAPWGVTRMDRRSAARRRGGV